MAHVIAVAGKGGVKLWFLCSPIEKVGFLKG